MFNVLNKTGKDTMQANRIFYGKEKPTNAVAGDCWFRNNELMILKNNWEASVNVNGFVVNNA